MKGIDTNFLVRYITQDDPEQTRRVIEIFDRTEQGGGVLYVSTPVLCELVWVLRSKAHQAKRGQIVEALEVLLATSLFEIESRDCVQGALRDYRQGPGDFSDYLIGWLGLRAGCDETFTFDRDLAGCDRFSWVGPPSRP